MPSFLSCFASPSDARETRGQAKSLLDAEGYVPGCPFCHVSVEKGFRIVKETADFIAFRDRSPQSETHLQIIPRTHVVSNARDLRPEHLPMLHAMKDLADELVPNHRKLGFHLEPFSSVKHLHMHVFAGKPTFLGRLKYPERERQGGKGWSWFVSWSQAVAIVERGESIGIGSSR